MKLGIEALADTPRVRAMSDDPANREPSGKRCVGRIVLAAAVAYGPGSRYIAEWARPVCYLLLLKHPNE